MTNRQENMVWWLGTAILLVVIAPHSQFGRALSFFAFCLGFYCRLRGDR